MCVREKEQRRRSGISYVLDMKLTKFVLGKQQPAAVSVRDG